MHHKFSSALQFACMALEAMGVAEWRVWGCKLKVAPDDVVTPIDPTGVWIGDACVAFLAIGQQLGDISTPQMRARREQGFQVRVVGGRDAMRKSLELAVRDKTVPSYLDAGLADMWLESQRHMLARMDRDDARIEIPLSTGPLLIHPDFSRPFKRMRWIENREWSAAAQSSLWRSGISAVPVDELAIIVGQARDGLPDDVALAVDKVGRAPTPDQIARRVDEWMARIEDRKTSFPESVGAKNLQFPTRAEMYDQVERDWPDRAADELRNLVEARWRVELGWDSGASLLPLFHDHLAKAVTAGLVDAA